MIKLVFVEHEFNLACDCHRHGQTRRIEITDVENTYWSVNLARMLARRVDGIMLNEYEQGGIGPDLFRHACKIGLEGLVSKRKDSRYKSGRSPDWIKVTNPKSPAMKRAKDAFS